MRKSEIYYIFNPITQEKREITYSKLSGITGLDKSTLYGYKNDVRKIQCINCYFLKGDITRKELDILAQKEVIEKEIWKPIKGTVRKYECSDWGRVREILEDGTYKILHIVQKKMGAYVCIDKKTIILSRLIYETFSCKSLKDKFVYHKDGNKSNNCYYNLSEELNWNNVRKLASLRSKPVIRINCDTGERQEFENITKAAKESFVSISLISLAIREKEKKIHGGYLWERDDIEC